MPDAATRIALLRKLAIACTVLVLAITTLSAYLRLAPLDAPALATARIAHRVAASAALLLVIALLMQSLARQPPLRPQGRLAIALLALCLFLAALGRAGGASRWPPVVLGNLLGGFALLALSARMVQACGTAAARAPERLRAWLLAAFALLCAQVALGALVSAAHLPDRCAGSMLCNVHRAGGVAVVALLLPLGMAARRAGLRLGGIVSVLVIVQAALGWLLAASPAAPLALALAHNVVAALLFAAVPALLPPQA